MQPELERRVPLGKALDLSDEDLDRLAEVTPQDILNAQAWVTEHATPADAALWEAKAEDETE